MRSLTKTLIVTALLSAGSAYAAPIQGTSSGTFSAPSPSCSNNLFGDYCGRTNGNSQLYWGSTNAFFLNNPSTLTATPLTINTNTPTNNTVIGELVWFNSSTSSNYTPDTLSSTYTLTVAFTAPAGSTGDTQAFNITIDNTTNPQGDNILNGLTLSNLNGLSFSLPGITVSDLHYVCSSGCTGGNAASFTTAANTSNWFNPENHSATLQIVADFTATATSVPEPASMALLGTALMGVGFVRRKKA